LPLSHYQVLEITTTYAGAYAGRQLAEAGLSVLRIELEAEPALQSWPPHTASGFSVAYLSANGKKESLWLDRHSEGGQALLKRLIAGSQVLLTDCPDLFAARSPGVTCQIHADRISGRYELPSSEVVVQAMSGAMGLTGRVNGPLARIAFPVADVAPGIYAATGVIQALADGGQQALAVHSLDAVVSLLGYLVSNFIITGTEMGVVGSGHPHYVPYGAFKAQDGYVIIAASTQAFWRNLCHMLERPDWIDDPRYRSISSRQENRLQLVQEITHEIRHSTVAEMEARLEQANVPNAPVLTMQQALSHPLTVEREMITEVGGVPLFNSPLVTLTAGGPQRPAVGRPWRSSLQALGLQVAEIVDAQKSGLIRPFYTPFTSMAREEGSQHG